MQAYRIADEPRPGGLAQIAVNPVWPLFAIMFAGPWLAWPWFVLNGMAVGSPTLRREAITAAAGFAGTAAILIGIDAAFDSGMLFRAGVQYAMLGLTVWKLGVSYWLFSIQSRTFGIYEYYGGAVKNGMLVVVIAGFFIRPQLDRQLADFAMLKAVLF